MDTFEDWCGSAPNPPRDWMDGPPPMINPENIVTDEALARTAKCYLENAIKCLNEASKRGLNVEAEMDQQSISHAGGARSTSFVISSFSISKDLLK